MSRLLFLFSLMLVFIKLCTCPNSFGSQSLAHYEGVSSTVDKDLRVQIIFSPECPVSLNHINDIKRLQTEFPLVHFELIFSGKLFSSDEIAKFISKYSWNIDWIVDNDNKVIDQLNARVMPSAFLQSSTGEVLYSGKVNDRPVSLGKVRPKASQRYLHDAIISALNGENPKIAMTEPVGCLLN